MPLATTLNTTRFSIDGSPQPAGKRSSLLAFGLITSVLLFTSGCGNDLATVSGRVTLDGQTIRGGDDIRATVYFNPVGAEGVAAVGLVDENGGYSLATGSESGIKPGNYIVTFTATQLVPSGQAGGTPKGKRISPAKYATPGTSDLNCTVGPGENTFNLTLTSTAP